MISLMNQISNPACPGRAGRVHWFRADLQLSFRRLSHYITGHMAPSGGTTCKHFPTWLTWLLVSLRRIPVTERCCKAIPVELWRAHTQKDGGIYVLSFFIYVHLYIRAPVQYKCRDLLNCPAKIIKCARSPYSRKIPPPELSATRKILGFYSKIKCGGYFTTTFPFFSCKMRRAAQRKIVFLVPLPQIFALTLALHSHYYLCYSECPQMSVYVAFSLILRLTMRLALSDQGCCPNEAA
jgi:hypothetical protein